MFGQDAAQERLYAQGVYNIVEAVLEGFNCTIFAYGQTGTGKTFTMEARLCRRVPCFLEGVKQTLNYPCHPTPAVSSERHVSRMAAGDLWPCVHAVPKSASPASSTVAGHRSVC